jgi:hypothetical protein
MNGGDPGHWGARFANGKAFILAVIADFSGRSRHFAPAANFKKIS